MIAVPDFIIWSPADWTLDTGKRVFGFPPDDFIDYIREIARLYPKLPESGANYLTEMPKHVENMSDSSGKNAQNYVSDKINPTGIE